MKTVNLILLILSILTLKGHTQSISENTNYPTSSRVKCEYKFNGGGGIYFDYWVPPSNCVVVDNSASGVYLYLKWKNIEASAEKSTLIARYHDGSNYVHDVFANVGPFKLSFPNPTFAGGATRNIPCYSANPVTISLNPYINTGDASKNIDENEIITSHFKWTLPSGWQTTGGKTGTFDANSSITVIPSLSSSTVSIHVQPYADTNQEIQYGPNVSLQITRNLEDFTIDGPSQVLCYETNRFSAPVSSSGVTYSWQLPAGWTGVSNANYIDVIAQGPSGNIVCTITGCNQTKVSSPKDVTVNIVNPNTAISGFSTIVCSSGADFIINNPIAGTTVQWNQSSNLTRVSPQGSNPCTFAANTNNSEGWIGA